MWLTMAHTHIHTPQRFFNLFGHERSSTFAMCSAGTTVALDFLRA